MLYFLYRMRHIILSLAVVSCFLFTNIIGASVTFILQPLVSHPIPIEVSESNIFAIIKDFQNTPPNIEQECKKLVMKDQPITASATVVGDVREQYNNKYITIHLNNSYEGETPVQNFECVLNQLNQVLLK